MSNLEKIIRPQVIFVDVYETLLDMSEVRRKVNVLMNSKRGYLLWFELFMQYCFVDNCMGKFNDFASIAKATFQMTANMLGEAVSDEKIDEILEMLEQLPVKNGVAEGLSLLADEGFRIAALTNSPQTIVQNRMERTGLISYFETVLSAEAIKKYKPCKEVYEWAAQKLAVNPSDCLLISAHGWDISGAANVAMQTAYLKQSNQQLYPLSPAPTITCKDLEDLASQVKTV